MRRVYTYLYTIEMHVLDRFLPSIFPFGNYLLSFKQAMISSIYRLPAYCVLKSLPFFFSTQKSSILFMKWEWKRKHSRALLHRQKCRNDERKKAKPEKKMLKVYVSFFIHFIIYSSHFLFHTWCDRCVFLLGMRVCRLCIKRAWETSSFFEMIVAALFVSAAYQWLKLLFESHKHFQSHSYAITLCRSTPASNSNPWHTTYFCAVLVPNSNLNQSQNLNINFLVGLK